MQDKLTGIVLAVCKDPVTKKTTALKIAYFYIDENNHIQEQRMNEYIDNGLPIPKVVLLKDIYDSKIPLLNFYISKTQRGTYKVNPKMGGAERYPILDSMTQEPLYYRSFTIVATASKSGIKTEYYWEGNDRKERTVSAVFKYFLVVNYSGSYSLLSEQQVINLGAKGYLIANGATYTHTIQPIRTRGHAEFPIMDFNFTDEQLSNSRTMQRDNSLPPQWSAGSYETITRAYDIGCKVNPELVSMLRRLADLLLLDDIRIKLIQDKVIHEVDCGRIQALYNRTLLWGTLAIKSIRYVNKIYKSVKEYLELDTNLHAFSGSLTVSIEEKEREEELWSGAYEDMQSTYSDSVTRLYNTKIYDRFDNQLKSVYCDALKAELMISNKLMNLEKQGICKLDGFNYRIKSPASLAEKVYERSRLENKKAKDVMPTLCDVLRYTVVFPCDDTKDTYTAGTRAVSGTSGLGGSYSLCKFANYWGSTTNPYRGINTAFRVPNNQTIFEVQFHTDESLDLKMHKLHELYEEQRAPGTSSTRYAELTHEMFALSDKLRVPKGVLELDMPVTNPLY